MRIGLLIACLVSPGVFADWSLNKDVSSLHFVSTKNDHIAEIHTFNDMQGSLKGNTLSVSIPLESVNTLIPIRDQRMKTMLFDLANYPDATFSASIDSQLTNIAVGSSSVANVTGQLTISGMTAPATFAVRITRMADDQLNVATIKPTVVNSGSFNLTGGIEALREVAMLKVISQAVPVTFNVTFNS